MRNLILLLCAGCSSGSLLVVSVDSSAPIADVARLHASLTLNGRAHDLDVPLQAKSIPPAHTFGVTFSSGGHVTVHLDAFDSAGQKLASIDGEADVGSGRVDLPLQFQVGGSDLGAPDGGADLARSDGGDGDLGGDGGDDGGAIPCGPGTHSCGGVCVASSDVTNCGASCTPCPVPLHASAATCDGTSCGVSCDPGYHACGDNCVYDGDPANCGVSCAACTPPTGGSSTCDGTQCGGSCPISQKLCAGACIPEGNSCQGSCPSGSHDCSGLCAADTSTNSCGSACTPCAVPANAVAATCDGTSCGFTCKSGYHKCGLACLSDTDAGSCGSSCTACPIGPSNSSPICSAGSCDWQCNTNFKKCGASCIPTGNCCIDADCAGSSHVMTASCVSGACQVVSCSAGFSNCDSSFASGCELDTSTSDGQTGVAITHCGSCSGTCPLPAQATGDDCVAGACHVTSCASGRADCNGTFSDGCELNLSNSDGQINGAINHCGGCGNTCTATANVTGVNCVSGACHASSCATNRADCDGAFANGCEADLTNSDGQTNGAINHCGACGTNCPLTAHVSGTNCTASACKITSCAAGFLDCDGNYANGCEVNNGADNNNCLTCGNVCAANAFCSAGSCTPFKRVFVTSTLYNGNLGGLSGADIKCQTQANAAGLGGTYKAWLSSSTTSASSRLTHSTSSYRLVDRTKVADNWTNLTSGFLQGLITRTEGGATSTGGTLTACALGTPRAQVWTGTDASGNTTFANVIGTCSDWTSSAPPAQNGPTTFGCNTTGPCANTGQLGASDSNWSHTCDVGNCQATAPLYCVEQ